MRQWQWKERETDRQTETERGKGRKGMSEWDDRSYKEKMNKGRGETEYTESCKVEKGQCS